MIIGVCGKAQSGKDSVANLLVADYGYTKLAFADGVREMAAAIDPYVRVDADRHFTEGNTPFARYTDVLREVGYERAKAAPDVRRLLQRIGTEAVRVTIGEDGWVNLLARRAAHIDGDIVVSDVRFPNEAEFIRAAGGIVVRVLRPGHDNGVDTTHASEAQVATIHADAELEATNMDELIASVRLFMGGLPGYVETMRQIRLEEDPPVISAVRVYLAAPWAHKAEAADAKARLVAAGVNVVSDWTERENTPAEIDATTMAEQARLDRDEVASADALVILNLAKSDGKASEMGMALAQGKRVILVGARTGNIFYHLPEVERCDTLAEAAALLGCMMEDVVNMPPVLTATEPVVEYMANTSPAPEPVPDEALPLVDETPKTVSSKRSAPKTKR